MAIKIDISDLNVPPEKLEYETAKYFSDLGKEVKFIRPSSIPKMHSPDILMDGVEWEIKTPIGDGKRTVESCLRRALKQSQNIIIDLRHTKSSEANNIAKLEKEFHRLPKLKKLYIIKKNQGYLFFVKKH